MRSRLVIKIQATFVTLCGCKLQGGPASIGTVACMRKYVVCQMWLCLLQPLHARLSTSIT